MNSLRIATKDHFDALVEALDQFVQNTTEAVDNFPNPRLAASLRAAEEMLDSLNSVRAEAADP